MPKNQPTQKSGRCKSGRKGNLLDSNSIENVERVSRLRRKEDNAKMRRIERLILVGLLVFIVLVFVILYFVLMISGNYSATDKESVGKIVTPIVAALIGFVIGGKVMNRSS
jgi:ABC-type Na+ efflux pump permease subunit